MVRRPRPLPAMPEYGDSQQEHDALVLRMIRDIHESVKDIDVTLRGERGENGLVSRVGHLERTCVELKKAAEEIHVRLTLKTFPAPEHAERTSMEKWKAIAIWGGVAVALLSGARDVAVAIMERLQ